MADARETFAAARCAQDELMQPCVDAALGEATRGASRDRWFFLVAFLEILFNLRTGSVDSKGHFDMRPWAAFKRYIRWQFWFDLVLLPTWWLVVRYYYTNEPKRGVDALNLRMLSWLRRAPPVVAAATEDSATEDGDPAPPLVVTVVPDPWAPETSAATSAPATATRRAPPVTSVGADSAAGGADRTYGYPVSSDDSRVARHSVVAAEALSLSDARRARVA